MVCPLFTHEVVAAKKKKCRRLHLPLPLSLQRGRQLDVFANHRAACPGRALGLSCETLAASGPPELHMTTEELRTCTFSGPGASKHHQKTTRRPPERDKKSENGGGRGKKKKERNVGLSTLRGQPFVAPPFGAEFLGLGPTLWGHDTHTHRSKWIGQQWIGQNLSNQDGQNGIGQRRSATTPSPCLRYLLRHCHPARTPHRCQGCSELISLVHRLTFHPEVPGALFLQYFHPRRGSPSRAVLATAILVQAILARTFLC